MSLLDTFKSALGLGAACPRCQETLSRRLVFTVPADERLELVGRLLRLDQLREDRVRAELEALMAARMELPPGLVTGIRATLEHCRACKHGALEMVLLKDGQQLEKRLLAAAGPGYGMLHQFLGGK